MTPEFFAATETVLGSPRGLPAPALAREPRPSIAEAIAGFPTLSRASSRRAVDRFSNRAPGRATRSCAPRLRSSRILRGAVSSRRVTATRISSTPPSPRGGRETGPEHDPLEQAASRIIVYVVNRRRVLGIRPSWIAGAGRSTRAVPARSRPTALSRADLRCGGAVGERQVHGSSRCPARNRPVPGREQHRVRPADLEPTASACRRESVGGLMRRR